MTGLQVVSKILLAASIGAAWAGGDDTARLAGIRKECGFDTKAVNLTCLRTHQPELESLYFAGKVTPAAKVEIAAKLTVIYGASEADQAQTKRLAATVPVYKEAARLEVKSGLQAGAEYLGRQDATLFAVDRQYAGERIKAHALDVEAQSDQLRHEIDDLTRRLEEEKQKREQVHAVLAQNEGAMPGCTNGPSTSPGLPSCSSAPSNDYSRALTDQGNLDSLIAADERGLNEMKKELEKLSAGR
jgi:hypothetical protein